MILSGGPSKSIFLAVFVVVFVVLLSMITDNFARAGSGEPLKRSVT